jgi:hypothetical protein
MEPTEEARVLLASTRAVGTVSGVSTPEIMETVFCSLTKLA